MTISSSVAPPASDWTATSRVPSQQNLLAESPVTGIVISKKLLKNQTSVLVLLQNDGALKVWKTKGTKVVLK